MQGIFQKENTDKALKYGIYRHLPTYEKIIRNLVSFSKEKRIAKLQMLETDLLEKQIQVEEYIGQIKKSEIRMILRFYYIDDLSWVQVSHRMNEVFPKKRKTYTEDSCRCKHNRYLEKFEKTTETTVLKC